jgi:hypothetical protein
LAFGLLWALGFALRLVTTREELAGAAARTIERAYEFMLADAAQSLSRERLLLVWFTELAPNVRIISARRATRGQRQRHEQNVEKAE